MTYPAFDTRGLAGTHSGYAGPVTCAACGCRLQRSADTGAWFHFAPIGGRDARGCRIGCADAAHDAKGHAEAAAS